MSCGALKACSKNNGHFLFKMFVETFFVDFAILLETAESDKFISQETALDYSVSQRSVEILPRIQMSLEQISNTHMRAREREARPDKSVSDGFNVKLMEQQLSHTSHAAFIMTDRRSSARYAHCRLMGK
jgi:hypothetical protein